MNIRIEKGANSTKPNFPQELQIQIALNLLDKNALMELLEKYRLEAIHWNLIAICFRNFQEYDLAEQSYLNAIDIDPTNAEPYSNLMSLYIHTKSFHNYENIYQAGMANSHPKYYIVFQDGRYQFNKGRYEMAYSAALEVLTASKMQDEYSWILGVSALLKMAEEETDEEKAEKIIEEAKIMLERGLYVFPNSNELNKMKQVFE